MGLESGREPTGSEPGEGVSTRWIIVLVILGAMNLLVWRFGRFSPLFSSLFLILSIAIAALGRPVRQYRRLVLILVVPGLLVWTLAAHGFHMAITAGSGGIPVRFFQRVAGEAGGQVMFAVLAGLLAGMLASIAILEGYVFMHQAAIQAFTGLDAKAARRALRSLVLNMNYPYVIVEDGKSVTSKPAGVFPRWGGSGIAIIRPGNAVVFQQGGELTDVELSGVCQTDRFETVYRIINLTPRDILPTPRPAGSTDTDLVSDQEENGSLSRPARNTENVLTKDRIPLDLDLNVCFRIKRKTEPQQDTTLLAFSSQPRNDFPEAYLVDKQDVFKAATSVNDWELAVGSAARDILRDIAGQNTLDELFQPPDPGGPPMIRGKMCEDILEKLNEVTGDWGVEATHVSIGQIDVPDEIKEQLQEQWVTAKQKDILIAKSQAQAEAFDRVEQARIAVQADMLRSIRRILEETGQEGRYSSGVLLSLRFIEALREIASNPSAKALFPYGIPFQDMDKLRVQLLEQGETNLAED